MPIFLKEWLLLRRIPRRPDPEHYDGRPAVCFPSGMSSSSAPSDDSDAQYYTADPELYRILARRAELLEQYQRILQELDALSQQVNAHLPDQPTEQQQPSVIDSLSKRPPAD